MQVQELVGIVPWNFVATICNLFIQVYLIKRFLFKPINEMLDKRKAKADAEIQDAVKAKEEAQAMKEKLSELGFEVNMLKITHLSHTRFVANKNDVTIDFLNWLQKKMPELNNMQFIYDPTETFSVGSDFTIVLAEG